MSVVDRIWNGLKAVIQLEADVARLTARVEQLDARERLIYLEGIIAGARSRAAAQRPLEGPAG